MKIAVLQTKGIEEDCVLSIRAGHVRRQTPLTSTQAMSFPTLPLNPLKVDVLRPVASSLVDVHQSSSGASEIYSVLFPAKMGSKQMGMTLQVREASGVDRQDIGTNVWACEFPQKQGAASTARVYLQKHNLLGHVQEMLQYVIHERPDDPLKVMAAYLLRLAQQQQGRDSSHVGLGRGCTEARQTSCESRCMKGHVGDNREDALRFLSLACSPTRTVSRTRPGRPSRVGSCGGSRRTSRNPLRNHARGLQLPLPWIEGKDVSPKAENGAPPQHTHCHVVKYSDELLSPVLEGEKLAPPMSGVASHNTEVLAEKLPPQGPLSRSSGLENEVHVPPAPSLRPSVADVPTSSTVVPPEEEEDELCPVLAEIGPAETSSLAIKRRPSVPELATDDVAALLEPECGVVPKVITPAQLSEPDSELTVDPRSDQRTESAISVDEWDATPVDSSKNLLSEMPSEFNHNYLNTATVTQSNLKLEAENKRLVEEIARLQEGINGVPFTLHTPTPNKDNQDTDLQTCTDMLGVQDFCDGLVALTGGLNAATRVPLAASSVMSTPLNWSNDRLFPKHPYA